VTRTITIVRSSLPLPSPTPGELVVSDEEVRRWILSGRIAGHLLRYRTGRLLTERLATAGRPLLAWFLRLMTRDGCTLMDVEGREREITLPLLLRWSTELAADAAGRKALLRRVEREIGELDRPRAIPRGQVERPGRVLYLRTDLSFGVRAGGSVGHIAGVVNEMNDLLGPTIFVTTADVPTLRGDVEVHHVEAPERFWNFAELPTFVLNDAVDAAAVKAVGDRRVSLVYQRYSLNNYAGLRLARRLNVPLVLEYNGSEIWMARHWGRPLRHDRLAGRIELLNVNRADLVVVVSGAMRDELIERGVSSARILVNPNAVDPHRYSPDIDGRAVRERAGLQSCTVIGFISTFQPWHGAEVLAEAFVRMMRDRPAYGQSVRLLMIGSGPRLARTRQIVDEAGFGSLVVFAGLIPQDEGASYLAACDILVSPHVPNPDGSPFFGSPTKLFEYMAMGKAIVASNLDQIGEVLRHGETALMVPPADRAALASAIACLIEDPARRRTLGEAARRDALAHYTWRAHVQKTIDALDSRLPEAAA